MAPFRQLHALAVLTALLPGAARAQQPAATVGSIRGYVFDSLLTVTTLPSATVFLNGPIARTVVADPRGRFGFDSLPPGQYAVVFSHPTLDEIGYAAPERKVDIRAGVVTRLFLSTAAGTAIYGRICPAPESELVGVLLGSLREAHSRKPVAGGEVRVEWTQSLVSRELGLTRRPRKVGATTDSLGRFKICGVPNDAAVLLRARSDRIDGPPLELRLEGRSLAIRNLSIDLTDSTTQVGDQTVVDQGTAALSGTVRQANGDPVAQAQVLVLGSTKGTETTQSGTFELSALPAGTHMVEVRAIGYERRREMVDLDPEKPAQLDLKMVRMAAILPELNVTAKKAVALTEFDKRRLQNSGGHFLSQEDIERRNPLRTEDVFRGIPGFSVVPSGGFDYSVVSTRGGGGGNCSPEFYIDGVRAVVDPQVGGGIPVNPTEIYGIEAYSGSAGTPAQFQTQNDCGVIAIWTRRGGPQKK